MAATSSRQEPRYWAPPGTICGRKEQVRRPKAAKSEVLRWRDIWLHGAGVPPLSPYSTGEGYLNKGTYDTVETLL